jgi:hypothetical protein
VTVIPAQPGWKILEWVSGDEPTEGEVYCSGDVIAFQIEVFHTDDSSRRSIFTIITPISVEGNVDDGDALEQRDGRITLPLVANFDSREDLAKCWLAIRKPQATPSSGAA